MANEVSILDVGDASKEKAKFPKLFTGIGKLKDFSVKLHIDRSVKHSQENSASYS